VRKLINNDTTAATETVRLHEVPGRGVTAERH